MMFGADPETDDLTLEQRRAVAEVENGPRGRLGAPFQALLEVPELMLRVQALGAHLRFAETSLPTRARELAVLALASRVDSGVEWTAHLPIAQENGVDEDTIRFARDPERWPETSISSEDRDVVKVAEIVAKQTEVPTNLMARLCQAYRREGATELIVTVSYYRMLATVMQSAGRDFRLSDEVVE